MNSVDKQAFVKVFQAAPATNLSLATVDSLKPTSVKEAIAETEKFLRTKRDGNYVIVAVRR